MPELPEVRTVAKYLTAEVGGKKIKKVTVSVPKMIKGSSVDDFIAKLEGLEIEKIGNYGKFLIFFFKKSDLVMLSHLRMEGKYHTTPYESAKHDHVLFELENKTLYYNDTRKFGTFHLKTRKNYLTTLPISKMGPEPAKLEVEKLFKQLSKKRLAIKTTLLDQTLISGIGNIYADEILWATSISPLMPANKVSKKQIAKIVKATQQIITRATRLGGTTIRSYTSLDKKVGSYQDLLKVHTKVGQPCPRCKTTIRKIKVNGRGTYFCPAEQKY